jgi:hypothetical protein
MYWIVLDRGDYYEYQSQYPSETFEDVLRWAKPPEIGNDWSGDAVAVYDDYGTCYYAREL